VAYPDIMFDPPMQGNTEKDIGRPFAQVTAKDSDVIVDSFDWDRPIQQIRVNDVNGWGISSLTAAMIWAKVYERFLEHRATLYAAYAIFATIVKENAVRLTRIRDAVNPRQDGESPVKGSTATLSPEGSIESFNSKNATTPPSEGIQFLEMVMMDFGFPPNIFGKEEPGGLSSAGRNKLFVLRVTAEQSGWTEDFAIMGDYILLKAVDRKALTNGKIVQDGTMKKVEWNEDVKGEVVTIFPPVVEDDVSGMVDTIVKAVTLDGKTPLGHITPVQFMELLQKFLKFDNSVIDSVRDSSWSELAVVADDGAFSEFASALREVGISTNGHRKEKVNG